MLFNINLRFDKTEKINKSNIYYQVLGGVLSLFENQKKIYDSIQKISFSINKDEFIVHLTILGKEHYNEIVTILLGLEKKKITIGGYELFLKQLDFKFDIFDLEKVEYKEFNKFKITFLSPTFVRNTNITFMLPNNDQFIYSAFEKLDKIYNFGVDKKDFKKYLKNMIYIGEFKIESKQIKFKNSTKAGVVGYVTYYIKGEISKEYKELIYKVLKGIKFVGIGSGVKLGCGNSSVFIYNLK